YLRRKVLEKRGFQEGKIVGKGKVQEIKDCQKKKKLLEKKKIIRRKKKTC
ncbi:7121_t:CDS:1, partial [Gigaspora margarita]